MRWLLVLTLLLLTNWAAAEPEQKKKKTYPHLEVQGQFQLQLDSDDLKSSRATSSRPVRNGIGSFQAADQLFIRRLRLIPIIHLSKKWRFVNETDFDPEGLEPESLTLTPLDIHFRYYYTPGHHIRIGQHKVPFGEEHFRSSRRLTMIERSDVSKAAFQRDIGLGAFGKTKRWEYGTGVYFGEGQNEGDRNTGKDVAARVVYRVIPELRIGASGYLGTIRPDQTTFPVKKLGLEAHFKKGPVMIDGEYRASDGYNLFSRRDSKSRGYYVYGIYQATDALDAVIGYDRYDPDLDMTDLLKSNGRTNDRDRFVVGVNYYFKREPVHRFMLNYEIRNELEGPSARSNGFRMRYQISW